MNEQYTRKEINEKRDKIEAKRQEIAQLKQGLIRPRRRPAQSRRRLRLVPRITFLSLNNQTQQP